MMTLARMIDFLKQIEDRVRPLVCDTYDGGTDTVTRQGRIMESDVDTIQLIAASLKEIEDKTITIVGDRYIVTMDTMLSREQVMKLKESMEHFLHAPVFVASGFFGFKIERLSAEAPRLMEDIREFHEKFGLEYKGKPRSLPPELSDFRLKFMREEFEEYDDATFIIKNELTQLNRDQDVGIITINLEQQLDALVDLVYVALGTAYLHGFDFNEAWRRVHAANMRKVRTLSADESKRGSIFDVIKPKGWTPPSHVDLVEDHEHQVKA